MALNGGASVREREHRRREGSDKMAAGALTFTSGFALPSIKRMKRSTGR